MYNCVVSCGAFAINVLKTFGDYANEPIPSDKDIQKCFDAPGSIVYHITHNGKQVGGAELHIENETHHNELALFYISPEHHGQGIGLAAWKSIEAQYPNTVL